MKMQIWENNNLKVTMIRTNNTLKVTQKQFIYLFICSSNPK